MKAEYEILDSMEVKVATADSFDDAMFAAEKYGPAMVVKTSTGKVIFCTQACQEIIIVRIANGQSNNLPDQSVCGPSAGQCNDILEKPGHYR